MCYRIPPKEPSPRLKLESNMRTIFLNQKRRLACEGRARLQLSFFPALLLVGTALTLPLCTTVQAQTQVCGSTQYLANLPVPPPSNSSVKRQGQLVNCSNQVILGAANAAHDA